MENIANLIHLVISSLGTVEVKGKENLSTLLGCINALESVTQILEAPPAPPAPAEEPKEEANG